MVVNLWLVEPVTGRAEGQGVRLTGLKPPFENRAAA
jgi:hypothetical protein